MLLILARVLGALSSYGNPRQIAFAMAMGFLLALIPGGTLIWFLIFLPMMLIRINQAAMAGTMVIVRTLMPFVDPVSEKLGFFILNLPGLEVPMGRFLSLPGTLWLRLNDSLVAGSVIIGLCGLPLFFLFSLAIVALFRRYLAPGIKKITRSIGSKVPILGAFGKALAAAQHAGGNL